MAREGYQNSLKLAATYIAFNSTGSEMLVNLGGEQVYLFDVNNSRHTNIMHVPQDVVRRKRNEIATNCCDVSVLDNNCIYSFYLQSFRNLQLRLVNFAWKKSAVSVLRFI